MKTISVYFKHHLKSLIFLLSIFVLPLLLFRLFSPYQEPRVSYVFLLVLILSQYLFYNEKNRRKDNENRVFDVLQGELGRVPSKKEINKRANEVAQLRGVSILVTGILILLIIIFI